MIQLKLKIDIYPLEAILNTCYEYLDKAYLYLDGDIEKEIVVQFKSKNNGSEGRLKNIRKEFLNNLIYSTLRCQINKNNKEVTELIVKRALSSALTLDNNELTVLSLKKEEEMLNDSDLALDDPLGIAVPWEEKYGRRKRNNPTP